MEEKIKKTIETYEKTAQYYTDTHQGIWNVLELTEYFLSKISWDKIIDIWCGPAYVSQCFSEKWYEVTGIDLTKKFLEIAKINAPKAQFYQMDMRYLTFPPESFDAIWACASFLHIPKKEANVTLLGFNKVLKQWGLMLIAVKSWSGERMVTKDHYKNQEKFFAFWEQKELEQTIETTWFKVIHTMIDKKAENWINVFAIKK